MSSEEYKLNEQQQKAVTHGEGPLLIVAGAGTGKTTVLAKRYAYLMNEKGCGPENILALTFTEKAAEEMETRVLQGLPNGAYDFWVSTFHGMCQRILEQHALEIGLQNQFRILTETDAWLLLKRRIHDLPLDHYRPLGNPVKFLRGLLRHISRAKDEGVTADQYLEFATNAKLDGDSEFVTGERARLVELGDLYFAYQKILRDEGFMDFGDLIIETLRLFRERPAVLSQFQEQFKFIFVDEFQDTNWAQYELVKMLAGKKKNLTVVGDDDQAIYKFRGASLANILQFRDDFPEAEIVTLTENYRSKQKILDTAYSSIQNNNPYRLEVQLSEFGGLKKLNAAKGDGGRVQSLWYESLEEELSGVARSIKEKKDRSPDLNWSEIAILVRSNDAAVPFLHALEHEGIPFTFAANRGLYRKPFVVDLLSLLTLCEDPHDSRHAWRVLSMEVFDIPLEARAALLQLTRKNGVSLWDAMGRVRELRLSEPVTQKIEQLRSAIQHAGRASKQESIQRSLHELLMQTKLLNKILAFPEGEKRETLHFLHQFTERLKRYEAMTHISTLKDFLDDIRLEIDSGDEGSLSMDPDLGPDLVNVMTVHASKGLEFEHVYLVGMVDQRFPTRKRSDAIPLPDGLVQERIPEEDTHMSEERRLFYVALTRAKESVTLTGASNYGGSRKKRASCFLDEMENALEIVPRTLTITSILTDDSKDDNRLREVQAFPLKRRFSFTQLAAFQKCPKQYQFAHMYRIPVMGSEAKSFGQAIHKTLFDLLELHRQRGESKQVDLFSSGEGGEIYPNVGLRVGKEEAEKIYKERWDQHAYWFTSDARKKEFYTEGLRAIRRFWEMWNEKLPEIAALERPFDWKIGQHSIKGSIDRLDRHEDGGVIIYDYKTSEPKEASKLARDQKKQLWLYQCAMEAMGEKVSGLGYIYVRTGEIAEVKMLEGEKKDKYVEELEESMDTILRSDFPPSPSEFNCNYCDFKDVCEFRK